MITEYRFYLGEYAVGEPDYCILLSGIKQKLNKNDVSMLIEKLNEGRNTDYVQSLLIERHSEESNDIILKGDCLLLNELRKKEHMFDPRLFVISRKEVSCS